MNLEIKLKEIIDLFFIENNKSIEYGLLSGSIGYSLLLLYYSKEFKDEAFLNKGIDIIEDIFSDIEETKYPIFSFCNGLAGLGWFLNHIKENKLLDVDVNQISEEIDDILFESMKNELQLNHWDFLHGGLGIGFYFLTRSKYSDSALEKIDYLLSYFENSAEIEDEKWLKWSSVLSIETKEIGYNISLSHGISSIAALMTKMYKENIFPERTSKLAKGALEYILKQEIDVNIYGSYFPIYSKEYNYGKTSKSRLGWCYGDLGISIVLLNAGRTFKNECWEKKAIEVLLYAAKERKDLNSNMIFDAGLCHGAVSVAHIFYRAWWVTNIEEFKDAAKYWYEQVLLMSTFKDGLAGFKSYTRIDNKIDYVNEMGLLEGVSGIGLSILSYITNTEPTWDECLLLS